jgi:thiol-disulfide isomerase/thioredoxin
MPDSGRAPRGFARWRPFLLALFFLALAALLFPGGRSGRPVGWSVSAQDDFDDTLDKARLNLRRRNYEEALKFFKKANGLKGNACAECLWGMAQAYSRLGAKKNVIETCDRLIQVAAENRATVAQAWNLKGITLSAAATENLEKMDEKRLREAEAAFHEVLKARSDFHLAHYNLGITLIRLNQADAGIQELKAYVAEPEDEETADEARKMIENPRRARENFAPDFSVTTLEGEYITSDDLRGKVVLVDFWGVWCAPCRESVPSLASLAKRFSKEPFVLLSVDVGDETEVWRAFIAKNKMTWPQYQDRNGKVQRAFQVNSFPTYELIDHEGVIRYRRAGYNEMFTEGEVSDAIKKALKNLAKSGTQPKPQSSAAAVAPRATEAARPQPAPPAAAPAPAVASASEDKAAKVLPPPVIEVSSTEPMEAGGIKFTRYVLTVKNWPDFPEELYAPVLELPPCGMNSPSTRLEVKVWSEAGWPLATYCNVGDASFLRRLWVMWREGDPSPARVYITLEDRRSQRLVKSNVVALASPSSKSP